MSATLLPGISVHNPRYNGLSLETYTRISVSDKVYEELPATLYSDVSVSNLGYTLGVYRSTGISVSDKVYQDLSATLFPGVSVSYPGYNSLWPGMILSIFCRWPIFTGLHFRWQAAIHRVTDWPGSSVAYRPSYTLSLTDIPVYTPGDRRLYLGTV